ncbi:SCO family protein [Halostagnicola kamekurae]|uniref:Protein SCO1/2 n=1 Tax=Halostagnicola kamekurae TaxID=619731 RepID=A0A1I6THF2_9EURY|nr:SCO family protein [Halostagnicola kamekurae]SFS88624.1 protein SCO1/2 [Halostagnicola kamekurae]
MRRRTYLASVSATGAALAAGCLNGGILGAEAGSPDTVLGPPDRPGESENYAYPAYGQELPEVTVPSPLHDREVTTTEFEGDRHVMMTFVFTRCHGPCPRLASRLAHVQADAAENGYESEVMFMPVTFDPAYDTAEQLRTFSAERGADPDAENWQFLRPESHEAAQEVVNDTFGIGFEKTETYTEGTEGHGSNQSTDEQTNQSTDTQSSQSGDGEMQDMFTHVTLIILANKDGYVERAYSSQTMPGVSTIIDDLETVREGGDGGFL